MAEIFVSYRREDSQPATERLADALVARFGAARVFRDRDDIVAGEDFVAAIRRSVEVATVLLAVVGPRWLTATDATGRRRLDQPEDFVRLEIEWALHAGVAVIPVLVDGATMPSLDALPASVRAFARCQALEIAPTRWPADTGHLMDTLELRFAIPSDVPRSPPAPASPPGRADRAARLVGDVFELALHPTRLIDRRENGRASDQARAIAFLAGSILAGNAVLAIGLGVPASGQASPTLAVVAVTSWLLAGELAGLVVAGLLGALLALAWRMAAGARRLRLVGIVWAYVYSGAWFGFCLGALVIGSAVQVIDPDVLDRVLVGLREAMATGTDVGPAVAAHAPTLHGKPLAGTALVLMLLGLALWVATVFWSIVAWGALRQTLGSTRAQAAAATGLWLAMLLGVIWAARGLG
jgi:hypothetical protein